MGWLAFCITGSIGVHTEMVLVFEDERPEVRSMNGERYLEGPFEDAAAERLPAL